MTAYSQVFLAGMLQLASMKTETMDSGLMAVFRLFTGIRLALSVLGIGASYGNFGPHFERSGLPAWISLLESGFLFLYLSWPWLQKQLGRFYLPLGLTIATLGPLVANALQLDSSLSVEMLILRGVLGQWQLVITLLLPLILVSWQYGFRAVVGYSLALALVDIGLMASSGRFSDLSFFGTIPVVIFRTLFYLLIGYSIARLTAELRQQNLSLEQANRRLASYAMTLEQLTVSRERNRLARELHDTLAHTLSGLAVQLEAVQALWSAQPNKAQNMAADALEQTRQGLNETRRAIQALRASPLEDLGLCLALEGLARAQVERAGMAVHLDLPVEPLELPPELEQCIYRIAEEALRNTGQHAGARHVSLSLQSQEGQVVLRVEDDGAGFDPAQPPPADRFGLVGMQERAQAVGGQVQVTSQPGQGTVVLFRGEV